MMNQNFEQLSEQGQQRRRSMLVELQHEIKLQHSRRRKRTISYIASLLFILISSLGYQFAKHHLNSPAQSNLVSASQPKHNVSRTFRFVTVEPNRDSVSNRYIDSRRESKLSFGSMSDDELATMLKSYGNELVLAEIDGQKLLIPTKL